MAVKDALGDAGFPLWNAWSRRSERYSERAALGQWRSFRQKAGGVGVGVGSLYHEAKRNGWTGEAVAMPPPDPAALRRHRQLEEQEERRALKAAQQAEAARDAALIDVHPYLERKGFPEKRGLICQGIVMWERDESGQFRSVLRHQGALLILMRHYRTNAVQSAQLIAADGSKTFLPGGRAGFAVHRIGRASASERVFVEGYATALSVRAAFRRLYRDVEVWCCFSSGNMPKVTGGRRARCYVVADHDAHGDGERHALATGLPYWYPDEPGQDANDYHLAYGIDALGQAMRGLVIPETRGA